MAALVCLGFSQSICCRNAYSSGHSVAAHPGSGPGRKWYPLVLYNTTKNNQSSLRYVHSVLYSTPALAVLCPLVDDLIDRVLQLGVQRKPCLR